MSDFLILTRAPAFAIAPGRLVHARCTDPAEPDRVGGHTAIRTVCGLTLRNTKTQATLVLREVPDGLAVCRECQP